MVQNARDALAGFNVKWYAVDDPYGDRQIYHVERAVIGKEIEFQSSLYETFSNKILKQTFAPNSTYHRKNSAHTKIAYKYRR